MKLLAIETSSDQLGVAVVSQARVLASYEVLAERPHATELPQAVTRVVQAAETTLDQLDGVVVDIGPGSFAGLRIGIAFVKALIFRLRKPVIGVPSLDVLAMNLPYASQTVCPIVDAKQRKVYTALYRTVEGQPRKQSDYHLVSIDQLLALLPKQPVLFVGDGLGLYQQRLSEALGERAVFAPPEYWLPKTAVLGRLGLARLQQGHRDDPGGLVPMYLYPRDCTIRPNHPAKQQPAGSPS